MKRELITFNDPKSPISEIFRTLRTNIQFMNTKKNVKTILLTSTYASEGKSWVSSNLAVIFAQTGKKVLLIDADMRKGRQYTIFRIAPKPGLSNYLSGISLNDNDKASENISDYIQRTAVDNLYVMPAGNIPPNPAELLISEQMVNLLEEVKEIFDIIIVDGTPIKLVTDSLILARMVDSTIIVTAHEETKREDLKKVVTNIQNVGGKISGIILNKVPVSAKQYNQTYYYSANSMKSNQTTKMRENRENNRKEDITTNISNSKREEQYPKENRTSKIEEKPHEYEEETNNILKQINDYLNNQRKS